MTKIIEKIEKASEDIAYAESGEFNPRHKKTGATDSVEDILTAIAMAEGGDEDFAKRLHPWFHLRHSRN